MLNIQRLLILLAICLLIACANLPSGPSVLTFPGSGKSFEQFRADDYECRQFAYEQVDSTTPNQSALTSGIESAAIATALGAAVGAIFGGGRGAAVGAGGGLLIGGLTGSDTARISSHVNQERYDHSYIQCMYAKNHRVPVSGRITNDPPVNRHTNNRDISVSPSYPPPPPPQ